MTFRTLNCTLGRRLRFVTTHSKRASTKNMTQIPYKMTVSWKHRVKSTSSWQVWFTECSTQDIGVSRRCKRAYAHIKNLGTELCAQARVSWWPVTCYKRLYFPIILYELTNPELRCWRTENVMILQGAHLPEII